MVTDQARNDVWQGLLDVARLVRYYEALANRHRLCHFWVRLLLLGAAASGIATLLGVLPNLAQLISGALVAILVVWDSISDYSKKATVLHMISIECSALDIEWGELWAEANDPFSDDTEVRIKKQRLDRKTLEVTGEAGKASVKDSRRLNRKCAEAAYKVTAERYAT